MGDAIGADIVTVAAAAGLVGEDDEFDFGCFEVSVKGGGFGFTFAAVGGDISE
jgi:hypothetical protein